MNGNRRGNNWGNSGSRGNNKNFRGRNGKGQNRGAGGGRGRQFQKFIDTETREKEPQNWGRKPWNYNNNYKSYNNNYKSFGNGGSFSGTSQLYSTDNHYQSDPYSSYEQPQIFANNVETVQGTATGKQQRSNSTSVYGNNQTTAGKDSFPTNVNDVNNTTKPVAAPPPEDQTKTLIHIKKEMIKTERKSASSSSSSSDSSTSSEEDEPANPNPITSKTKNTTRNSAADSLLNIKLKPISSVDNASVVRKTKKAASPSSASSSSSSSEDENEATTVEQLVHFSKNKDEQSKQSEKPRKKKTKSEDDVVCMGNLENKITLEDDDDGDNESLTGNNDIEEDNCTKRSKSKNKYKKSSIKSVEQCMLCDKKGHTSFQCQMICKNCSAPYHGFRTCPHPANLNTMLQLYMEFCMQQLQNFQPDRQFQQMIVNATDIRETVPQPLVGSPSSSNKTVKRKKQMKTKETSKTLSAKKRKLATKKKHTNHHDAHNYDSENTSSDSTEGSSDSDDDSSSEGFQSLTTNRNKKSKTKHKNSTILPAFNFANFMPNHPSNYPLNLNGIPNITTPATSQLNTMLLSQMFQNAIGSINQRS